jgi:hypothetical protein
LDEFVDQREELFGLLGGDVGVFLGCGLLSRGGGCESEAEKNGAEAGGCGERKSMLGANLQRVSFRG